ncbi:MAG: hypothetical protein A4E32_01295 [Methanomassiliicoccales archaeon PtaU1.Bin124]|nr:MAG: hypothetical protein A4E32_01295 [Methanomassiliicoccales archaeon PtaU1.Bin124]
MFIGTVLIFCHLFTGLVLGLLLYKFTSQRWTFWACALGSVLPDLIDKPLGHILLQSTLDNGRLYAHTLLFFGIVMIAGAVLWKGKGKYVLLALGLGILLHQLADTMFLDPTGWFWPLFGPFQAESFPDYFGHSILVELTSAYEWVFGLASAGIIVDRLLRERGRELPFMTERAYGLMAITWALFLSSLVFAIYGLVISGSSDLGTSGAMYISAIVAAAGGLGLELASK